MLSRYVIISGVVFGVIAAVQLMRALYQWPVQIGGFDMPVWASWIAVLVAGSLCVWAFGSNRK
jgi:high-affinity Fe2+/Pb2+ permease